MNCPKCGGILFVIRVEEPPKDLSKKEKAVYNRLCDLECGECGTIVRSQPYDFGRRINPVRDLESNN